MEGLNKECGCPDRAFKLILMDIQMPIMDGIKASKMINEAQGQLDLSRIVAVTSFTGKKAVDDCLAVGIKQVFNKPLPYK